jgi:metal-responsive CopG/Arc/MetJ family transcriptional regulator
MEQKKREIKPTVETKLTREDFKRVEELAKEDGVSKSELVRQALLWYMAHRDELKNEPRDTMIVNAIEAMTNRVCAMLARQGRQVGTLVELTYSNMSQTKEGKAAFEAAFQSAKQKQARSIEKDERELVEAMKRTVELAGGKLNV